MECGGRRPARIASAAARNVAPIASTLLRRHRGGVTTIRVPPDTDAAAAMLGREHIECGDGKLAACNAARRSASTRARRFRHGSGTATMHSGEYLAVEMPWSPRQGRRFRDLGLTEQASRPAEPSKPRTPCGAGFAVGSTPDRTQAPRSRRPCGDLAKSPKCRPHVLRPAAGRDAYSVLALLRL